MGKSSNQPSQSSESNESRQTSKNEEHSSTSQECKRPRDTASEDKKTCSVQLVSPIPNKVDDARETLSNVEEHMLLRAIKKSKHCFVEENLDRLKEKQRYKQEIKQVLKESTPVKAIVPRSILEEENREMLLKLYYQGSEDPDTDTIYEESPKATHMKKNDMNCDEKEMIFKK